MLHKNIKILCTYNHHQFSHQPFLSLFLMYVIHYVCVNPDLHISLSSPPSSSSIPFHSHIHLIPLKPTFNTHHIHTYYPITATHRMNMNRPTNPHNLFHFSLLVLIILCFIITLISYSS